MKKKWLISFLALCCLGACALGFTGCAKGEKGEKGDKGDQGVGIEKVEYDKDGNLVITLTDGTTQTVPMPEKDNDNSDSTQDGAQDSTQEGVSLLHYQRIIGKDEYCVVGLGLAKEVDIVIPDTYNGLPVTRIGEQAFWACNSLKSITIPDSVTSIGVDAFYACDSLTSVYISDIVSWCNIEFEGYNSNPLSYAKSLYLNNKFVSELIIPDSVTSIGNYAFSGCRSLTSVVIPDSVTSIGRDAFSGCSRLTNIEIPNSVTSIGEYAFYSCSSLTSVVIPDSVTSIGYAAFYNCSSLTSVVIPNSITSIGRSAFFYCESLTSITFKGTVKQWNAIEKGGSWHKVPAKEVVCLDGTVALEW